MNINDEGRSNAAYWHERAMKAEARLQKIMARCADLLDEDQFNELDAMTRATDPTPAPQPTVVLHDNKANVSVRCPDCDDGAYKGTDRICLTCNGLGELRRATFPTPAAQPTAALSYAQLDAANVGLANESARLQEALRFYADKQHIQLSEPSKWDAPDDEASNWLCDDAGTATIEDGWMAREALKPFEVTAVPTDGAP